MKIRNQIKLGIIGTVGVPARYGGFETLVHYLVQNIDDRFEPTVYCSGKAYKKEERKKKWKKAKLHYIPLEANGIQSILYDLWSIIHAIRKQNVLLILGVSGCLFLPFIKLFSSKKIIVNIDGLEWRRPKWNVFAKKFLLWSEKIACRFADEIITDNRIIKEYVKIRYGIEGNLIEYGADHVNSELFTTKDLKQYDFMGTDYAFKVARIEPENNVHTILEAFSELPHLPLVIVGNWNNSQYGKTLKEQYSSQRNLFLLDPIYDTKTLNVLRSNAKVYIHGHSAGGTNPSLVEAMYLGLPIIAYDVLYNRVTTNNQSLFFESVESLRELIRQLPSIALRPIANALQKVAFEKYTWKIVSDKYSDLVIGKKPVYLPDVSPQPKREAIQLSLNLGKARA